MRVLAVIDMQNDFIDGALGTKEAQDIVPNVVKLIEKRRSEDAQIIFTMDTHEIFYLQTLEGKNLPIEHCIKGTQGWKITDKINTIPGDIIVPKNTFGYLKWDMLLGPGVSEIEVIGLCTDICVISNALILRALYPNKNIVIYEDCTAGVTPEAKTAALEIAKANQIEVRKFKE